MVIGLALTANHWPFIAVQRHKNRKNRFDIPSAVGGKQVPASTAATTLALINLKKLHISQLQLFQHFYQL